jgi:tetratricopeptide (TPR) repeat protein
LISEDLYSLLDHHSLEKYEKCLEDYKEIAFSLDENKKSAEALLEMNEFYINFVIKPTVKTTLKKNQEDLNQKQIALEKEKDAVKLANLKAEKESIELLVKKIEAAFDIINTSEKNKKAIERYKKYQK